MPDNFYFNNGGNVICRNQKRPAPTITETWLPSYVRRHGTSSENPEYGGFSCVSAHDEPMFPTRHPPTILARWITCFPKWRPTAMNA